MSQDCTHPEHWFSDFGKRDTKFELSLQIIRWFHYRHDKQLKPGTSLMLWNAEKVRSAMEAVYWDLLFEPEARKIGPAKKVTLQNEVIKPLVDEFMDTHRALIAELEVAGG